MLQEKQIEQQQSGKKVQNAASTVGLFTCVCVCVCKISVTPAVAPVLCSLRTLQLAPTKAIRLLHQTRCCERDQSAEALPLKILN